MQLFTHIPVILSLVLLILIHASAVFIKNKAGTVISFVGIGLHIAALPLLLYYKLSIEDSVLFYMISVFSYTLISVIYFYLGEKKACSENDVATDSADANAEEGIITQKEDSESSDAASAIEKTADEFSEERKESEDTV